MDRKNSLLLAVLVTAFVYGVYYLIVSGVFVTGMVTSTFEVEESFDVNESFNETSSLDFERERVSSLRLTGFAYGNGTLEVDVITSDGPLRVVSSQLDNETVEFYEECEETCSLEEVNVTELSIVLEGNLTFDLESLSYYVLEFEDEQEVESDVNESFNETDSSLELVQDLENKTVNLEQNISYNLSDYFEGEDIDFDARSSQGYSYEIINNELIITGEDLGVWRNKVYASKDGSVLESNDFFITVLVGLDNETAVNETHSGNETINDTVPINESDPVNETEEEPSEESDDVEEEETDSEVDETEESEEEAVDESEEESVDESEEVEEEPSEDEQDAELQQVDTSAYSTRTVTMERNAMQGVLSQGSTATLIEGYYKENTPGEGDIIALDHVTGTRIKIVRGVPGDSFEARDNRIYVNEQVLTNEDGEEHVISNRAQGLLRLYERDYNGVIPDNAYLIKGNLANEDTGSARFGLVHVNDFEGRITN